MNYSKTKYGHSQSLMDYNKILKSISLQEVFLIYKIVKNTFYKLSSI